MTERVNVTGISKPWWTLIAALVIIALFVILVGALVTRQRGPVRVVFTGNGVADDGRTPVATFVLTNLTTRGYIAFGKNGPHALYRQYRDTWAAGQTNWFDDYEPGQRQWVIDVDPHSGVAFSIPLPALGRTREFAVMCVAKPKEKPSPLDVVAERIVRFYRRYFPQKTPRIWYAGVLRAANPPASPAASPSK